VVTGDELAARREAIAGSPDLQRLLTHLRERAQPVLERLPTIPEHKALLSMDGGFCPDDGATLTYDPWSPAAHRCPRCGKTWTGDRHDRQWARFQHLWVAERAVHLAALAALGDDAAAGARASAILHAYAERYWRYPTVTTCLARAGSSSRRTSNRCGSRTTWRPRRCSRPRDVSTTELRAR